MQPKASWIIKSYLYVFIFLSLGNLTNFIYPWSDVNAFHQILMGFNPSYVLSYVASFSSALINVFSAVPIFLYIYQRHLFNAAFWQKIFAARIVLELLGHQYDYYFLKSLFYFDDTHIGLQITLFVVLSVAPSYLLAYRQAFQPEKIYSAPHK